MKKLVVTMLTVLTCGAAYALPVGNPSEASLMTDGLFWEGTCADMCDPCASWCDAFSFRVGFYGDYVFNRHMEQKGGGDIEDFEIYTNAGYLALNAWNRVDIFATLGVSNFYMEDNARDYWPLDEFNGRVQMKSEPAFSWSVGGRVTLWECGCTTLGLEGQYFRTKPDVERGTLMTSRLAGETIESLIGSIYPDDFMNFVYSEWQVGLGISHRINMFVPYIAVKWAQSKTDISADLSSLDLSSDVNLANFENRKDWGYAVGVSLVDCEKASLTVEGRFADEKAVYVNGQFRF